MEDKRFTVLQYYLALHLSTSLSQYLSTSVLQYISTLVPQYISISVPQTLDFDHLVCPVLLNTQLSSLIRSPIVPKLNFRLTSSLHSPNPLQNLTLILIQKKSSSKNKRCFYLVLTRRLLIIQNCDAHQTLFSLQVIYPIRAYRYISSISFVDVIEITLLLIDWDQEFLRYKEGFELTRCRFTRFGLTIRINEVDCILITIISYYYVLIRILHKRSNPLVTHCIWKVTLNLMQSTVDFANLNCFIKPSKFFVHNPNLFTYIN